MSICKRSKTMTDIEKIAMHYGFVSQSRQTIEEMAELTVAISKIHRDWNKEHLDNLIEELADVQIMLEQMIYLTGSKYDVQAVIDSKVKRQLKRMQK